METHKTTIGEVVNIRELKKKDFIKEVMLVVSADPSKEIDSMLECHAIRKKKKQQIPNI